MSRPTAIVWFRQDLRLADNPALYHAAQEGYDILPLYIVDTSTPKKRGSASAWWLHHSLNSLSKDMKMTYGEGLTLMQGDPCTCLLSLAQHHTITKVFWNRLYDDHAIKRDTGLKQSLKDKGIEVASFNGSLLHEPWEIQTGSGTPFKVFTPFWRTAQTKPVRDLVPRPPSAHFQASPLSVPLQDLGLLPTIPWDKTMQQTWMIGEQAAQHKAHSFVTQGIQGYKINRDRPDLEGTSKLSPHLHFGEISPVDIWHQTQRAHATNQGFTADYDCFLSELGWREFSYHLLYTHPTLDWVPLRPEFATFPHLDSLADLKKWQQGLTGYPIVDAGMRQLWATGWMHNRVRMITASFLIKDLLVSWQLGEQWFWDTLVDADPASNAASWQWVAGCGADASPYFRIFNPILQSEKFDPNGDYVRRWVPELRDVPTPFIHKPWVMDTPPRIYPAPIINHDDARKRALAAYASIKKGHTDV